MEKILTAVLPPALGFILDTIIGDPYSMPHPIRLIGNLISRLEKLIRKNFKNLLTGGIILAMCVLIISCTVAAFILILSYRISVVFGIIIEGIMCFYLIAAKCLKDESMKVYRAIENNDTEGARKAVSMIVGRDTDRLDKNGIIRAAVETVAENTSDGITAPMMYISLGGGVIGFFYKAVNTMDSMIGYKNEKYLQLGRFAARLDDAVNYIPSRITAAVKIFSAYLLGYDYKSAYRIWKRDRHRHASPNSAQTEAVCAGALNIRLAGDAYYFGKLHKKEFIGDNKREIRNDDILSANKLMYMTSFIILIISLIVRGILWGVII